jgi:hypothetical protein
LNDWFRFVVFPMLTLAAFSGMFSSADTCVSALLYLTEWNRSAKRFQSVDAARTHLRWAMALIFAAVVLVYPIVRRAAARIDGLTMVASTIFSTAVILAPTILLLPVLKPAVTASQGRARRSHIVMSIVLGSVTHWLLMTVRVAEVAGLKPFALTGGLAVALVPAYRLLRSERRVGKEPGYVGTGV